MATTSENQPTRTESITLRIHPEARALIDKAAQSAGKNRTEFMLEAAQREARNVLLDQRYFSLTDKAFNAFMKQLDQSPRENPQLRRLLETPAPWDR